MEGAERYPPRSNAALAGCFAMTPSAYNDRLMELEDEQEETNHMNEIEQDELDEDMTAEL